MRAAVAAFGVLAALLTAAPAGADATDDYPIPNRILRTSCTAEQIMAAVRDVRPVYYECYMIDYNNKGPDVQQAARDRINWFFSLDYAGRRQYSENTATNAFFESMAWRWPNWALPTPWPRWVRPARPTMCKSCSASPTAWCSVLTATAQAAALHARRSMVLCPTPPMCAA